MKRGLWPVRDGTTLFIVIAIAILAVAGFLTGCDRFETNAYKTLKVSATVYDTGMRTAADLHRDHLISDREMDKVVDTAGRFRLAYLSACAGLEAYHVTGEADDKARFNIAVAEYSLALNEMVRLINQYRERVTLLQQLLNDNPDGISRADPMCSTARA